jgi:hypothetical protein
MTSAAVAAASEHIVLTSGVVKAVDHATGVIVLDSGLKLRVRHLIVGDEASDIGAVRVNTAVFVSGVVVGADGETRADTRTTR